ncbi:glycosyltransferase family 2 protein [Endozoicomonas sp. G2_1]|uniref:glycosyltransferase n=1 Tax=Endozoicomonas sp. G2_1 TaxID=2821091 RepID=UPI001ADD44C6|nr:glycosyltransferase family A protein [Endozoicomonas sp. G2_1]MBO9490494.1 glycosyltransferase family 2 protein [Endozoicomonas sp. G2_1]
MAEVSFIIPHKGREELLYQTVESIFKQDYPVDKIEVVIVSQNESLELLNSDLKAYQEQINVLLVDPSGTVSKSRNIGAQNALGDYLAFIDSDIDLSSHWLSALKQQLDSDTHTLLVSGQQVCAEGCPDIERLRTAMVNTDLDQQVSFLPGCNLLLKRSTFEQADRFPEQFISCEDFIFTNKVSQFGKIIHSSAASFVHLGEDKSWKELFNKEMWRARSNLSSLLGRKIPLSEIPSLVTPPWVIIFALLAILFLLTTQYQFALFSSALMLLPILLYSSRLFSKLAKKISYKLIFKFYLVYFSARGIGTFRGLLANVQGKK